jgi:hypothetical protein
VKRNPVIIRPCPNAVCHGGARPTGTRSLTSVTPHVPAAENVVDTVDDEPGDS